MEHKNEIKTKPAQSELDFYIGTYAELKVQEKDIKKRVSEAGTYLKNMMTEQGTDSLENEDFQLNLTESTGTIIHAVDMLRELGFKIPKETEETIDKLFSVNITESKRLLGAMQLNKIMKPGKVSQTMRIKNKNG